MISSSSSSSIRFSRNKRLKRFPRNGRSLPLKRSSSASASASSSFYCSSSNNHHTRPQNLKEVISLMKPFDLLYFRGPDFVSDTIRIAQEKQQGKGAGEFSHVGMIVSSEILDDPKLKPGRMYVFESTMSGSLADGVKNVNGESFFGTQVRDIETLVKAYDKDPRTAIAWCALKENKRPIFNTPKTKRKINDVYKKLVNVRYDWNFCSLLGAAFKPLRCLARASEKCLGTEKNLFCSELVATFYKEVGIIPPTVNPANVVPSDFLGFDIDQGSERIKKCVLHPVYLTLDDENNNKRRRARKVKHRYRSRSNSSCSNSSFYSFQKKTRRGRPVRHRSSSSSSSSI